MRLPLDVEIAIPVGRHLGAFGARRKHHMHEGVDLYAPEGSPVYAMNKGVYLGCYQFTGEAVGSPWWNTTHACVIAHEDAIICYGELCPLPNIPVGYAVNEGDVLGVIVPVLKKDKGRPMSMLHVERYSHFDGEFYEWAIGQHKPSGLCDPTPYLLKAAGYYCAETMAPIALP